MDYLTEGPGLGGFWSKLAPCVGERRQGCPDLRYDIYRTELQSPIYSVLNTSSSFHLKYDCIVHYQVMALLSARSTMTSDTPFAASYHDYAVPSLYLEARQAGAEIQCYTFKKGKEGKEAKKRRTCEACEMSDSKRACSMPV